MGLEDSGPSLHRGTAEGWPWNEAFPRMIPLCGVSGAREEQSLPRPQGIPELDVKRLSRGDIKWGKATYIVTWSIDYLPPPSVWGVESSQRQR